MNLSEKTDSFDAGTSLSDAKLHGFYKRSRVVKFKKDEIIFLADDEPRCAYAVKTGFVRSFIYTDTNDERSISFVLKNEMLPIAWVYSKSTTALFHYIAHTDCELYKINREQYRRFLENEPELAQSILMHSMSDNVTKMLEIQALEQATAERKVLHTFNYFSISYGKPTLQNLSLIKIPLTQKDIAGFTGLTRETVTNIIIKLKHDGMISVKRRYYTVDVVKLRTLLEIDSEIPILS